MGDAFWEGVHKRQDTLWLTGSNPREVLALHAIYPPAGSRVLDHGVGQGQMAAHLRKRGCEVVSCDIIPTHGAIHPSALWGQDAFDYAISHLTAQHLTDEALQHYAKSLPMKAGGVATIQWASLEGGKVDLDGPLNFRTRPHTEHLLPGWAITRAGNKWFRGAKIGWWISRRKYA